MRNSPMNGWIWTGMGLASLALAGGCSPGREAISLDGGTIAVAVSGGTQPTVAMSTTSGRSYVAWIAGESGSYDVLLATIEPGSYEASPPRRVNDVPGDAAPHDQAPPQVLVGPREEIYVVWQNNTVIEGRRFPASDLRLAVSLDGGESFAPAVTVNDDFGGPPASHTFHDAAVGPDGTLFVSWIDTRNQHAGTHGEGSPNAAEAGPEIRVATSADRGASFRPSVVVDRNPCPCCRTSLAVGHDGSVYVAWRKHFDGDVRDIVVARAAPGSLTFGEPVRVSDDRWVHPGCPHAGPSLAVDADDRLHVGWYTGKEGRQGLWYAVSDDRGATFGARAALVTDGWVPPSQVAITRVGDSIVAAWEDRTSESGRVLVGSGGRGSSALRPNDFRSIGRGPAVAGAGGTALIVWLDGEAIRAQRLVRG